MSDNVCRAITFINFHIPLRWDSNISVQYTTIGFFDGLFTKRIDINYKEEDLKPLWQYTNSKTAENEGYYSYQNVFGFSRDSWNNTCDEIFWDQSTDEEYPLTFIVFLQVRDYMVGVHTIEKQCGIFSDTIDKELAGSGKSYTYSTIDKNDFITCIKSKSYSHTVKAIKKLHNTGVSIVYSYTIFSVNTKLLEKLNENKYKYLFIEEIPSICLKGITNSFDAGQRISLDRKYRKFCDSLIQRLYGEKDSESKADEDHNKVLYDILGDNDFRLIARKVSLGRLLKEYASGGILCYREKAFPYYLFSSSMVLNTKTGEQDPIDSKEIDAAVAVMQEKFTCKMCNSLSRKMDKIMEIVKGTTSGNAEFVTTFCQGIFQLLQSLKVLETAPTKKYDFISLYLPLEALIRIIESKISDPDIGDNKMIYEFVHKISMTLHGTLRTDIQFFQIRDFNVIVHYAPAKIRAFYALWAMKVKDLYEKFIIDKDTSSDEEMPLHEYSFILAPGMYKGTAVRQLFENNYEAKHLMLITLPERHIYSPRWITIVLAHEVSHFVGSAVRNREDRHNTWLKLIARILELELYAFFYKELLRISPTSVIDAYKENRGLLAQIQEQLIKTEEKVRKNNWNNVKSRYHSEQSIIILKESYNLFLVYYINQILKDFSSNMRYFISDSCKKNSVEVTEDTIRVACNEVAKGMSVFCSAFGKVVLEGILTQIKILTAETFADIMAILTLELSPLGYIRSFAKTELKEGEGKVRTDRTVTFINVRIAIVAETISRVFSDNPDIKPLFRNYNDWIDDPIGNIKNISAFKEAEKEIARATSEFIKKKGLLSSKINTYSSVYDVQTHSFKRVSDFFRDEKVFEMLCDYLGRCAKIYINNVAGGGNVADCRNDILKTYRNLSEKSEIELMSEIESFLFEAEKKYTQKDT